MLRLARKGNAHSRHSCPRPRVKPEDDPGISHRNPAAVRLHGEKTHYRLMIVVCAWILGTSPRMTKGKVGARVPRSVAEDWITAGITRGTAARAGIAGCAQARHRVWHLLQNLKVRHPRACPEDLPHKQAVLFVQVGMIRHLFPDISITYPFLRPRSPNPLHNLPVLFRLHRSSIAGEMGPVPFRSAVDAGGASGAAQKMVSLSPEKRRGVRVSHTTRPG